MAEEDNISLLHDVLFPFEPHFGLFFCRRDAPRSQQVLAAHHFRDREAWFRSQREQLTPDGEICVLNFDYSVRRVSRMSPVARIKQQFAAQVRYNWSVLEHEHGGVDFVSPEEVARELEAAGFSATVHPCGLLKELFFILGRKA